MQCNISERVIESNRIRHIKHSGTTVKDFIVKYTMIQSGLFAVDFYIRHYQKDYNIRDAAHIEAHHHWWPFSFFHDQDCATEFIPRGFDYDHETGHYMYEGREPGLLHYLSYCGFATDNIIG
jgi:hypothetical protein